MDGMFLMKFLEVTLTKRFPLSTNCGVQKLGGQYASNIIVDSSRDESASSKNTDRNIAQNIAFNSIYIFETISNSVFQSIRTVLINIRMSCYIRPYNSLTVTIKE